MKTKFGKMLLMTICLLSMAMLIHSQVEAADIKDHPRVAIMPFGDKAIKSSGMGRHGFECCSEYAIVNVVNSGKFDVFDLESVQAITNLQAQNMSGLFDMSTAVETGKLMGAQFIFVGNVTGLTTKESGMGLSAGRESMTGSGTKAGISGSKHKVTANVTMRIVDMETGRIVAAGMGKGASSVVSAEISFKRYRRKQSGVGGGGDEEESVVNQAESNQISETAIDTATNETPEGEADVADNSNNDGAAETVSQPSDNTNVTGNDDTITTTSHLTLTIGTTQLSETQVLNALCKAIEDAFYGKMGLFTVMNGGKPLKHKKMF